MKIKQIEINTKERVESGPIQFNQDWPGLFIRGDNAFYLSVCLKSLIDLIDENRMQVVDQIPLNLVRGFIKTIESCRV